MAAKEELQDDVPRCEFIHAHPETIKSSARKYACRRRTIRLV